MSWKFELLKKPIGLPITEGPVWDGESLYFTHIHANTIFRCDPNENRMVEKEGLGGMSLAPFSESDSRKG